MKKILYLSCIAMIASSCAIGTYNPMARNHFGAQTTVVLDKANFRVVRDVEAVVEVNNYNLHRQDVEKSAYGQLLKNARLTGSQVLINVVVEEVVRENTNIFRALFGIYPKRKQYVAARATVIEFIDETGKPVISIFNDFQNVEEDSIVITVSSNQKIEDTPPISAELEPIETQITIDDLSVEDISRLNKIDNQKDAVYRQFKAWNMLTSDFFLNYIEVYNYLYQHPSENNINALEQVQRYANKAKDGVAGTQKIGRELRDATSIAEKIRIFTNR